MPGSVSGASWDFKENNVLSALSNTKLPFLECQGCWALLSVSYMYLLIDPHWQSRRWMLFKKFTNNKCWRECGETGTLLHCWWECKLVQPLWRTVWRFLKKLKIELPYDPAIQLLGIYPGKLKTLTQKDICSPVFIAALFTVAKK